MIEVKFEGRLGNNLFQYALGRILAEDLGYRLKSPAISHFHRTTDEIHGASYENPVEILTDENCDLQRVLANRSPRKIVLDGYFQDWRFYRPYRERIRDWFSLDSIVCEKPGADDVVVQVRRTDYVRIGWALPFSYYQTAIEKLLPRNGRLIIATDDPADPFFRRFRRWRPTFLKGGIMETMASMAAAQRVIMSQSTFAWWPTFLSRLDQSIVCPDPTFGCWGPAEVPDLIEEDRFNCIPCDKPYTAEKREKLHQQFRHLKRRSIIHLNDRYGAKLAVPHR